MKAFRTLFRAELTVFLRDRMSFFFTLLFPLIFILLFGFLMGDMGQESAILGVVIAPGAEVAVLEDVVRETGVREIKRFEQADALETAVAERNVDFGLIWDNERLRFLYHPSRVQENYAFEQIAEGISAEFNLRHQGLSPVLTVEKIHVGTAAAKDWFNIAVPGIIAFSILSSGLFAVSGHLTSMKERRILDRMIVTPMSPLVFLTAVVSVRLVVVYLSTLITLFVSIGVFRLAFAVNWLHYTVFVVCATLGMMGFGTLISLVVRRPSSAGNVANVLSMLMLFFSGVYFPIEVMPAFLRAISKALPLTYMAEAMRFATGVSETSLSLFWTITLALLASAVVLLPFLARYVVRADRR
jgi:ABC-2 type transport system permease protein